MSLIVAYKENGNVYMGCDGRVSREDDYSTVKNPEEYKIVRIGDILVGLAGSVKLMSYVKNALKCFNELEFTKKNIVKYFYLELLNNLYVEESFDKEEGETLTFELEILLAKDSDLYYIDDRFVSYVNQYSSIGSGADYVEYILASRSDFDSVEDLILTSLKSCSAVHFSVGAPYFIANTKDLIVKEIK